MDSGVLKHMIGLQEVFDTLDEWDSKLHMVLGDKIQRDPRIGSCIIQDGVRMGDADPGCVFCTRT